MDDNVGKHSILVNLNLASISKNLQQCHGDSWHTVLDL